MTRVGRQLELCFRTRGGARRGAGRPPKEIRAGVSHLRRPEASRHQPLHVTLRTRRGLLSLRAPQLFPWVRKALASGRERFGFRLVHFSVMHDHLHLIVEADEQRALSRGLQGLCVRVARNVNRALQRKGSLFADRYHARPLKTPRAVRLALRYVLLNVRKHARLAVPAGFVDPCSSAAWFEGFGRPRALVFGVQVCREEFARALPSEAAPVALPRTWLLRVGQGRAGPFDVDDTPSG